VEQSSPPEPGNPRQLNEVQDYLVAKMLEGGMAPLSGSGINKEMLDQWLYIRDSKIRMEEILKRQEQSHAAAMNQVTSDAKVRAEVRTVIDDRDRYKALYEESTRHCQRLEEALCKVRPNLGDTLLQEVAPDAVRSILGIKRQGR